MNRRPLLRAATLALLTLAASSARAERFTAKKTLLDKLVYGIDTAMDKDLQLNRLMTNFGPVGFKYTGTRSSATQILAGKAPLEGDCGTLVAIFAQVAKSKLGIDTQNGAWNPKSGKGLWVDAVKIVDAGRGTGNVDNGKGWFFTEHYWRTFNGKAFDVLFMKEYPSAEKHKASYQEIDYDKKGDVTLFKAPNGKQYQTNEAKNPAVTNRYIPAK